MDSEEADIFVNTLTKYNLQKSSALYKNKEVQNLSKEYNVQDVILNISKQIKAIQNADSIKKGGSNRNNLDVYKKSNFVPVSVMSTEKQTEQVSNKFETQCVLDTQLINIIEDAEALMHVTENLSQEFDSTLNSLVLNNRNNEEHGDKDPTDSKSLEEQCIDVKNSNKEVNDKNLLYNDSTDIVSIKKVNKCNKKSVKTKNISTIKKLKATKVMETETAEFEVPVQDDDNPKSPILNISPALKPRTPPHLVYKLESFEKFESIAISVISDNPDFEAAKRLINSQIMDNELFMQSHAEPVLGDRYKCPSPILKIMNRPLLCKEIALNEVKANTAIEDEILFSSDEEDNVQNFEELPLTCALETSFYNQHDVLDKTMYVGFQTASNKSIQVHRDSYCKAKSILDNVNSKGEEISLTKLVEDIDNSSKFNAPIDSKCDDETLFQDKKCNLQCNIVEDIKRSEHIHAKNKRIFHDLLEDDKNTNTSKANSKDELDNFNITNNKKIKLSENCFEIRDQDTKVNADNVCAIDNESFMDEVLNEIGETEMINNELSSKYKENINIDENIAKEFESNFVPECNYRDKINIENYNTTEIKLQDIHIAKKVDGKVSSFGGFKTANNKEIIISEKSLAKTKNVFKNIELDENDINDGDCPNYHVDRNQPSTSKIFMGFRTANDEEIKVSEVALAKTKNIFDNIDNDDILPVKNIASDDKIHLNANRKKTTAVLNKNELKKVNNKSGSFINPLLSNKNSKNIFTKPKIEQTNALQKSSENLNSNDKTQIPSFVGFKTASNKAVHISAETLAKSEKIYKEICDQKVNESSRDNKYNLKTITNKPQDNFKSEESNVDESNSRKKTIHEAFRYQQSTLFANKGFKTASNKPVKISNDALKKSKKLFEDLSLSGFSEEVCITHENKQNSNNLNRKSNIQGFRIASNKHVSISDEALAKTKNIFRDIDTQFTKESDNDLNIEFDCFDKATNQLQGFRTANNKPVTVTEDALCKSKKIFQDIDNFENQINANDCGLVKNNKFVGFKTASNKTVKVSEDSLMKTNKIFQDFDMGEENKNLKNENELIGFQTANNKLVKISNEAILKSKRIFEGIDLNENKFDDCKNNAGIEGIKNVFEFKTANNTNIQISEDSLRITTKLFNDEKQNKSKHSKSITEGNVITDTDYPVNIDDIINTEVIKDFEESLHTEDFAKDMTPINKRSGSPILSCPKAKKRKKFETPETIKNTEQNSHFGIIQPNKTLTFCENYKMNKKYTLKNIKEFKSSSNVNLDSYILNFEFDTLLDFKFGGKRSDIDSDIWTTDKIKNFFTDCINKKIVPEGWIENHLKLIIWKLISYEIYFSNCMKNVCTVKNVLQQLKYRYDRELYNVERPALRKILEKDEVPSKLMVLCVAGLCVNGVCVSSVTNQTQNIELLLSDGWYCIKACTDKLIDKLICDGKICVGSKLVVCGAELMNCEQGIAPWEDTSSVRLKISGNSTRRAKWDTRLGFHGNGAILSHVSAVKPEGGKISRLRVFVSRVYPMLYVEKFEDGSTVTRSERLEHLHQMKFEANRQNQIEKLYDELERMSDQESQDSEGLDSDRGNMETGSQICRSMKRSKDSTVFRVSLTESQAHLLEEHTMKKREKVIQNLQRKVQELVKKRGLDVPRNVVPLLKIRVADMHNDVVSQAVITIWRPNECLLDLITESAWLEVYNVVPTGVRFSELQISAGRQSIFQPFKTNKNKTKTFTDTLKRKCCPIKDLHTNTDYEVDIVGLIFLIEPQTNQFQNIYLTDENKNFVSINFWGGIKKFGFENVLDTGQIVACLNLQRRSGNTKERITQYRATELSNFTRTCKIDSIKKTTDELSTIFSSLNKKKFIDDCVAIKNNFSNLKYGNTENITPYRLNNSDYNISKNRLFIDSPLAEKLDINLNLSGLDFESTFKQTDTQDLSPKTLLRKKKVNEKIAKLKMYGEPPPLSSIHLKNKTNKIKPYKSPLILKNDISNVASDKNLPENGEICSSPILLNRTYIKSINPVKLNFSGVNEDNATDPFSEEFDCSPPLSLD